MPPGLPDARAAKRRVGEYMIQYADRVSVRGGVDRARLRRSPVLAIATEGAAELAVVVLVHALTDQQRACTAVTVLYLCRIISSEGGASGEFELRHVADGAFCMKPQFREEVKKSQSTGGQVEKLATFLVRRRTDEEQQSKPVRTVIDQRTIIVGRASPGTSCPPPRGDDHGGLDDSPNGEGRNRKAEHGKPDSPNT